MKPAPRWLRWSTSALMLALAAWLLWRALRDLSLAQLQSALASLPASALVACLAATALSFACLAAYEAMATRWLAPGKIPRAEAWRTGLVAHALANTLGFHAVTAVALRLGRYRAHGVDTATLARIVVAIGGCVASGVAAILVAAAAWWLWDTGRAGLLLALSLFALAATCLLATRLRAAMPASRLLPQFGGVLALGLLEMAAAVAAFAVLVPSGALPGGPAFVLLFVGATVLGVLSHSPGGLGVFEATILAAAAPQARAQVLAALLAYRALYNLLPCALALLALVAGSLRGRFSSTVGTQP